MMKTKPRANPKKAMELLQKIRKTGLTTRFKGMNEDQILVALKKTREEIWKERFAARP